ncbi:assimilatory sulfite reductase (NADPH) flavoprotein subunit [Paenibacillus sp. J31TS4]|uniref:assimilatory sulfite reductase (NADPH) flavoprotein subunit n=1 Tax=Paenibacillus sp. J31TS4 TaxID=2807195 RepID=UPI001BCC19AD|nr:assimilatory sulfite reductase (NADPH) flavoprotein subunit [Paenibacillus sp. J31TS4]
MSLQVTNSPFNQEQAELLNRLLPTMTEAQRIWLSGYLMAIQSTPEPSAQGAAPTVTVPLNAAAASKEVTVLYGSQTGNSHGLAKKVSNKLEERGFQVTLFSMGDFKPNGLKKVQNLLIVVSTHGEGDPPDNAIPFYEFLHSKRAPQLNGLRFSVLALGDLSYEFFCKTGKDFDKRLEELGAERLSSRVDCDVDFDEPAAEWMNDVLSSLSQASAAPAIGTQTGAVVAGGTEAGYDRTNPFQATVLENLNLNGRGSDRETRHIELSLEGSNLQYEPGDSLGIYPENHPRLVDELIETMGWKAEEPVPVNKNGEKRPLREALLRHFEITVLTKPLLEQAAKLHSGSGLQELMEHGREQDLRDYLHGRDLLDLVQDYSFDGVPAREFVSILRKIPSRLYSIASSSKAFPDEAHLTVRAVRYEAHGRDRYGVASLQLAERVQPGDTLPIYIQHNPNFKLPATPDTPIIMIGPGTGVAPFRAFLSEREETGAQGKTWLFFGDQHFATDFLYQIEWKRWLKDGVLTRMDVAFSRDSAKKVYVQHRMLEKSRELYQWLLEGACVYVCGDEKKMAHDVHAALAGILELEGRMSPEEAADYLIRMQQQKRYQRDVY